MCERVHVWEGSACIINVAFSINESRGCAAAQCFLEDCLQTVYIRLFFFFLIIVALVIINAFPLVVTQ